MKVLKQQNVFTCRRNYILTNFSIDPLSKPPRMSENKYPWSPLRRRSTSSRIRESVCRPRSSGSSDRRSGWAKPESDSWLFRFSSSEVCPDRVPPRPHPPRWWWSRECCSRWLAWSGATISPKTFRSRTTRCPAGFRVFKSTKKLDLKLYFIFCCSS